MSEKMTRDEWYDLMRRKPPAPPGTLAPDFDGSEAAEKAVAAAMEAVMPEIMRSSTDFWIKSMSKMTETQWERAQKKNPLIVRATFEALGDLLHIGDLCSLPPDREIGPEMRVMDRFDETQTYWLVPAMDVPLDYEDG